MLLATQFGASIHATFWHYVETSRELVAGFILSRARWAGEGVFEFPGQTSVSGRYEGQRAIEGFFRRMFDRMATIHFTVKQVAVTHPFALGLSNTALCEWALDETSHDGIPVHLEGVSVLEFRHGQGVAFRDYIFDTKPLEVMWGDRDVGEATPAAAGRI